MIDAALRDWQSLEKLSKEIPDLPKKIGCLISKVRLIRGFTQKDVAFALGVSRQYISLIERGELPIFPSIVKRLRQILNFLDISLEDLLAL